MKQFKKYEDQIKQVAIDTYPNEAVIFITDEGLQVINNISLESHKSFSVSIRDTLYALQRGLKAVVHSHPNTLETIPSDADIQTQINFNVPFGLVGTDGKDTSDVYWWEHKK